MGNPKIVVEHDFLWKIDVSFQRPRWTHAKFGKCKTVANLSAVPRYLTIAVEDVRKLKIVKKVLFLCLKEAALRDGGPNLPITSVEKPNCSVGIPRQFVSTFSLSFLSIRKAMRCLSPLRRSLAKGQA